MLTLTPAAAELIKAELESVPEKYQKPFNSTHEAIGVILEEFEELKDEVFFGEKRAKLEAVVISADQLHKERIQKEAVQVAAMCVRLIQELT